MSQLIDNLNSIDSIKSGIKSAIEAKGVDMTGLSFADYPGAISSIQTGGNYGQIDITENGTYYPSDYSVDAFSEVVVSVPSPQFITETLSVSTNGTYTPGQGVDGFSQVEVDVQPELQNKTVVVNGEYVADQGYYGLGTVTVSVPSPQFVTESLSVSTNGTYTPGAGVDGFSVVVVNVPQSGTGYTEAEMTEGVIININNNASYVGSYAFYMNGTIQTANLPNCSLVGKSAFGYTTIVSVNLPVCKKISFGGFLNCSSLSQIILPSCEEIIQYGFGNCNSLSEVSLPVCSYIGSSAFEGCKLSSIVLPMATNIEQNAFRNCNMLSKITLGASSVCSISTIALFIGTLISSNTGSIYVPASLVDTYKSARFWSYYSNIIFPISE